jgi:hypothetical protein
MASKDKYKSLLERYKQALIIQQDEAFFNEKSLRPAPQKAFLILSSSVSDLIRNGR